MQLEVWGAIITPQRDPGRSPGRKCVFGVSRAQWTRLVAGNVLFLLNRVWKLKQKLIGFFWILCVNTAKLRPWLQSNIERLGGTFLWTTVYSDVELERQTDSTLCVKKTETLYSLYVSRNEINSLNHTSQWCGRANLSVPVGLHDRMTGG